MKKAGIIIGVVFIIVAIIILVVGNKITMKTDEEVTNTSIEQKLVENEEKEIKDENKTENKTENKEEVEVDKPIVEQNIQPVVKEVVTQVVDKDNTSVKTINANALNNPSETKEVIAVISNKRILLIDEQVDAMDRKMLTYVFDVMTPDNSKMVVFVTKSVYDSYNVNDRLKVNFVTYKNDVGVEFPLVNYVSSVE